MGISRSSLFAAAAAVVVLGAMFAASRRSSDHGETGGSVGAPGGTTSTSAKPFDRNWRFADATATAGLSGATSATDALEERAMAAPLGLGDFNGDGRTDIIAGRIGQPNILMMTDGPAHFAIAPLAGGAVGPAGGTGAFAVGDVDADGDLDIVATSLGADPNRLYLNDGTGKFSDGTAAAGLPTSESSVEPAMALRLGATLHDWDGDGDLDLVVAHWDPNVYSKSAVEAAGKDLPNGVCAATSRIRGTGIGRDDKAPPNLSRMYRNDGGRFVDVTASSGIDFSQIVAFTPMFSDVDGDGRDDLLLTGDGCTSHVFKNDGGGHFADITKKLGVGIDENGMGSAIADLDHDGREDWFVTAIAYPGTDAKCPGPGYFSGCHGNAAYVRMEDGSFKESAADLGIRDGGWGWGVVATDLDNSGSISIAMTNGYRTTVDATAPGQDTAENRYFQSFSNDPMKLWIWQGNTYRDIAGPVGLLETGAGRSQGRALAAFDADGDGDLDLVVNSVNHGVRFLENRLKEPNHWLEVALDDAKVPGNRKGIGATVTLDVGGQRWGTSVRTDGSYGTVALPIAHFGLGSLGASGDAKRAFDATLNIRWPDGEMQKTIVHAIDQRVVVTRGS